MQSGGEILGRMAAAPAAPCRSSAWRGVLNYYFRSGNFEVLYTPITNGVSTRRRISPFPSEIFNCTHTKCFCHQALDRYAENLTTCLLNCAFECLPSSSSSTPRSLAAWNDADGPSKLKDDANFFGIEFGNKLDAHPLVLFMNCKETQKEDTNPPFVI